MRILMVTEASSGGAGRHVIDLVDGLQARGCSTGLVYSPSRCDATFEAFVARQDAGSTRTMEVRRGPHWSDRKAIAGIREFVQQSGPFDVVHGHCSKAGLLTRASGLGSQSAVVYTAHGIFTMNPTNGRIARAVARFVERALAPRCDAVIAVSPHEHDHIVGLGIPESKVHYVPNGVRSCSWPTRAAAREAAGLDPQAPIVGYVGRLTKEKNPLLLVEAFATVAPRFERAMLAMVGDGPLLDECLARARELRIEDRIVWLGYRDAAELLPAFDIMAIPSRFESLPYVVLEAMSAGVPVVATAVAGMKMAVRDGENGLLVDRLDADAFGAALGRLLGDAALLPRLADEAKRSVEAFTADGMVDATLDLYRQLVAARNPPLAAKMR
ncbi:MAG: glycosyltransferase family 4 protein [Planctomycetota bacterium]|jgi:glycosyltransferase involved in cell wall biosynthesis